MNPWSRAERGSEATERELFARRARALGPAEIPSLASVLRAADERRETYAARSAHGRAFVAMALAAACMMAAATRLPTTQGRGAITAELDASAPRRTYTLETTSGDTCTLDDEVLVSEEKACSAPAPLFTAALFTAAPRLAASLAVAPTPSECGSDESREPDAVCR